MNMDSSREKEMRLEQVMPLIQERLASGQNVKFSPRGVSMLPMLRQGIDSVVLSPIEGPLKKYDLPLYRRDSGQFVLHRIVKIGTGYTCVGDNQFELERGLRQDQMIAVVSAFYRGDVRVDVNSWKYRVYCHCWHYSRPVRHLWRKVRARLRRLIK